MAEGGTVAILGAGMAGAVLARRLVEAGVPVRVFDKGRGLSGRMATRRTEAGLRFDHGAPAFQPEGDAFARQCRDWTAAGVAAPWGGHSGLVGVPDMPAPVRHLLDGIPVSLETTIARLARADRAWTLTDAEGTMHGPFDVVAVTFPAPQVAALAAASALVLPGPERATYAPRWSLMLDLDGTSALPEDGLAHASGPIALVSREAGKPGRSAGSRVVVHASQEWSRDHLEASREAIQAALVAELERRLGRTIRPAYVAAHRWRYAFVATALGQDCLYDAGQRLGAGGDWCLGPSVEAAYDSGRALAGRILADLRDAR